MSVVLGQVVVLVRSLVFVEFEKLEFAEHFQAVQADLRQGSQ